MYELSPRRRSPRVGHGKHVVYLTRLMPVFRQLRSIFRQGERAASVGGVDRQRHHEWCANENDITEIRAAPPLLADDVKDKPLEPYVGNSRACQAPEAGDIKVGTAEKCHDAGCNNERSQLQNPQE